MMNTALFFWNTLVIPLRDTLPWRRNGLRQYKGNHFMRHLNLKSHTLSILLLTAATPALAQDNFCAGIGADGVWIGDDRANSNIAMTDTYREQMALLLGDNQYVSLFTLSDPTDVRVEAEGRGSGDPIIDLFDQNGSVILSDDDSGGNAAARAETTLQAGTYCMAMRSYDGGPMTAFVRIGRQDHEPLTTGVDAETSLAASSCQGAAELGGLGTSVTASVNDAPFWRFTLDTASPVTVTAENEDADPVLMLYDQNDDLIAENDDFDGLNSRINIIEPLEPGTYCLEVAALDDNDAPIVISLGAYDAAAALQGMYDRGEIAPPLDGSVMVTDLGVLESRLRQDLQVTENVSWYSVDMTAPGLLLIEAIGGADTDAWLIVFDDLGREIGMNDDYGDSLDSFVAARVQDGTFIIGVRQYEGGQGLVRLLAERYVRAP